MIDAADRHGPPSGAAGRSPRFLVIRSGAIGDTLMATPLFRALRASFPDSYIAALTSSTALDALRFNPQIDEVFALKRRHLPFFISTEKRRLTRYFCSLDLDAVLSLESGGTFTELACRAGAKRIITYDPKAACGNVTHLTPERGEHSAETHLRAASAAGAAPGSAAYELHWPEAVERSAAAKLAELGVRDNIPLIGMHAGWGSRRHDPEDTRLRGWPASRFAELIGRLARTSDRQFILTGTTMDRPLNEAIAAASGVPVINAAGRFTLLESAAVIRRMSLYLTIDSGPAHIAAAVGTPLVNLWGPGILEQTRPIAGDAPVEIVYVPPPCAPCYGTELMKFCTNNLCMKSISPEMAYDAALRLLAGPRG